MYRSIAIMLTLCLATVTTQASLLGRAALTPGGTNYQAYYDDVYNLTWVADANFACTFGHCGYGAGAMHWPTAQSYASSLNTANYLGTSTWRLPTANLDGHGIPNGTGEMNDMYFSTLGNTGSLTNTGPFLNLMPDEYWTGTSFGSYEAVVFGFSGGYGGSNEKTIGLAHAWFVSSGDSTVPIPAAVWLFGSALGLMGVMRRKISS